MRQITLGVFAGGGGKQGGKIRSVVFERFGPKKQRVLGSLTENE